MPITAELADELANAYLAAEATRTPIGPIREAHPDLGEDDAYAVSAALARRKEAGGLRRLGYKNGATNPTAIATFGLTQPVYGRLFDAGMVASGGEIAFGALIHPRLECEVAFRLGADLAGPGVTPEAALAAVAEVIAAFEVVDARTEGWGAKMPEMIGDNVFQARFVLGDAVAPAAAGDLAAVAVTLQRGGEAVQQSTGANVLGNPAASLAWLANRLAEHGDRLRAGEVVLAGSLTPLLPIAAGDSFEAVFSGIGVVRVRFV